MILVDTPVWIDHLRRSEASLVDLLARRAALIHPFVVAELALGNLTPAEVDAFAKLPQPVCGAYGELMRFIEIHSLQACGVGYVDAHLLLAVTLTPGVRLWTRDRNLRRVAGRMSIHAEGLD